MIRHALLSLVFAPVLSAAVQDPATQRMHAVELVLAGTDEASLRSFTEEHLAPAYVEELGGEAAALAHVRDLRAAVGGVGGVGATGDGAGRIRLHIRNESKETVVAFVTEAHEPHRIVELVLESSGPVEAAEGDRLTWELLEEAFEEAEAAGFSGSVLAVRDGEVVLDAGYGFADPERRHPVTTETLFAIGSTPIDFTHGGILLLEEVGALSLEDPLTKFFADVPEDKRGITLDQLRTGRSGLYDFPGIPGVDENLDCSWIDRAEFLRRVFGSELLFEPGTNRRHSHAAWGVLAAVIEVVSGKGYEAFLRENFFEPAGMDRTGHYPITHEFEPSEVAVGLGGNVWGEVNSPRYWGETSWLVLGSGGMVSTPGDLYRWRRYLAQGLGAEARAKYGLQHGTLDEGGNDRGFINTLGFLGIDTAVIVCSNSHRSMGDDTAMFAMAVAEVAAE